MKLKSAIGFVLGLSILFAMGCQQDLNKDVTSLSSVNGVAVEGPYVGNVIIGDADGKSVNDSFVLNDAAITDDSLTISVSYSGGCKNHQFTLITSESFLGSFPVQLIADIVHNANGDTCEAWPTEDYRFDLTPIKTMYQKSYQQKAGAIVLQLKDAPNSELVYEFDM